jgi:hypothetical protein
MTDDTLPRDYTLDEVAASLRMSSRWLRGKLKEDKLEHERRGHKLLFTAAQVEAIRTRYTVKPVEQSMTTGRKRRAS